jgi:hypothetical protein
LLGLPAANVSGKAGVIAAGRWRCHTRFAVVDPAYHCRGSIDVYVPVAGIVNGSRKPPELPKFELRRAPIRSGFSTDTRLS